MSKTNAEMRDLINDAIEARVTGNAIKRGGGDTVNYEHYTLDELRQLHSYYASRAAADDSAAGSAGSGGLNYAKVTNVVPS